MYFITDVDGDDKRINSNADDRNEPRQAPKKRKTQGKTLKVSNVEKRILAKLVEQESVLWDQNNKQHCNNMALLAAWDRVASEMPGRNVTECKTIWRSLKDAVRYRKNKIAKTDDTDEIEEYELDKNWEFSDCMSFLMNASFSTSSTLVKRPRRNNPEDSQACQLKINSVHTANSTTNANTSMYCNDDTSASESNCSYTARKVQQHDDDPLLVESLLSISNSIRELIKGATKESHNKPALQFEYIWQNLDKMFQKLPEEAVDELNVKFIQLAYEKIPKVKQT